MTEVSWVGTEIRVKGDDGPNLIRSDDFEDGDDRYITFSACGDLAGSPGDPRDAECARRGRFTVGENSSGDPEVGCGGDPELRYVTCGPIRSGPRIEGPANFTGLVFDSGAGDDEINCNVGGRVSLGHGNDRSSCSSHDLEEPAVDGGPGDDTLTEGGYGGEGNDVIHHDGDGGPGHDRIIAEPGGLWSRGGPGNDILRAGKLRRGEIYRLYGNAGRDRLIGTDGLDFLDGGKGRDSCDGRLPNPGPNGRNRDRAVRCEVVRNVP